MTIDDAPAQPAQPENNFYDKATPLLQLVMILLAVAMELGAGFALHEVWRLTAEDKEDWDRLRKRLAEVRLRLGGLAFEIRSLQIEPRVFSARFWSNFYRAMLTQSVRSAMTKLLVAVLAAMLLLHGFALAQTHTNMVVALDLSLSEAVRGPDEKTEYQKNVDAVTELLARVPADSGITVIGITDHSFAQPYILLSVTIPPDPGYFGERLATARNEVVRAWSTKSVKLSPCYRQTDILGALVLAGQIFGEQPGVGRKILVIYSDMRNSTPELNLESPKVRMPSVACTKHHLPMADLHGVKVFALGVDAAGKSIEEWQCVRDLWRQYFIISRATLIEYSGLVPSNQILLVNH